MGSTAACMGALDGYPEDADTHHLCRSTRCDCGCHHATIDAHFDGAHYAGADPFCHECIAIVGGEQAYYDNLDRPVPAWAADPTGDPRP